MLVRLVVAVLLLAIAAFCVVGVLATFEPPGSPFWRLGYGAAGVLCVAGAVWTVVRRRR